MEIIGSRVRSLREYKDWFQEDLARESGLQRPHISLIENNERTPGADSLMKLATALETSTDYLLGLSDSVAPYIAPEVFNDLSHDPDFAELAALWPDLTDDFKRIIVEFARKDRDYNLRMRQQEHPDHSNHF